MGRYKHREYVLQVGDKVEVRTNSLYLRTDVVTRVTTTQAICEKDTYTVRYPRVYDFGFSAIPYVRSNTNYDVLEDSD